MADDLGRKGDEARLIHGLRVTPRRRLAFFIGVDGILVSTAVLVTFLLRFQGNLGTIGLDRVAIVAGLCAAATVSTFIAFGLYRISWAFFGLRDAVKLTLAMLAATAVVATVAQAWYVVDPATAFPRTLVLIQAPLSLLFIASFRLAKRLRRIVVSGALQEGTRTLIVGAGEAGVQVLKSIQESTTRTDYHVVGFIEDDALAHSTAILGVPVLGPTSALGQKLRETGASAVVICVPDASGEFVADVVETCRANGIQKVRIVPTLRELMDDSFTIESTRDVRVEDLIGRDPVKINPDDLHGLIAGKRVLVTGAAGTIGAELCRQVVAFGPSTITVLDTDESRLHDLGMELRTIATTVRIHEALVDVRNARALEGLLHRERPQLVFHAAAYKHVPMMEAWPIQALDVNVLGTANVMYAAQGAGCESFVLISTDKAVDPSSVMGASKRLAELVVFSAVGKTQGSMKKAAVRFGNVLGSRGSVLTIFEKQIQRGGPVTVTHPDVERYFMVTSEAVSLVLQAAAMGDGEELFVLEMGKPVRILRIAEGFIRLHGLEPGKDIKVEFTGLRPGERLQETLTYPSEPLSATKHPFVLRARAEAAANPDEILEPVRKIVLAGDEEAARSFLLSHFPRMGQAALAPAPSAGAPTADQRLTR
ncbi:MAG: polysaccharide biosynthesis protein [Euryarchaeota archaeon]|nr:polysaccharide biosynthesis protein [Euryarchaeota archaeon]